MNHPILMIVIPLLFVGFGLSVRPLPLRVDASDPADRIAQHCQRISFFLLAIPAIIMGLVVALIISKYSGGPGLVAYRSTLYLAGVLWKMSSIFGIFSGLGGSVFSKRCSQGYELIVAHVILLFVVIVGPYFQYAGHPD